LLFGFSHKFCIFNFIEHTKTVGRREVFALVGNLLNLALGRCNPLLDRFMIIRQRRAMANLSEERGEDTKGIVRVPAGQ
jgi:hypothetical protein